MNENPPAAWPGLTPEQAAQRLAADGPNELPQPAPRTLGRIALEALREPMLQLLLASVAIYAALGDRHEAAMLSAFVAVSLAITLWQERRTERVLETLRELTSPRALVLRGGERLRIQGSEVVVGDLLLLGDGDRIAADAQLLACHDLLTDESLLSGESMPVPKSPAAPDAGPTDRNGLSQVYAGTLVISGQGLARVTATGARSEIGRIGKTLGEVEIPATPLLLETRRLVRIFSVLGLGISLAVLLLYGWLRADWLGGVLAGLTLAMSMLPQEFLLILTVFTAMGAWRLSRQQVLTRRSAAIETLGAATVLCTDKTGTLTLNRMAVAELALESDQGLQRWRADGAGEATLPAAFHALLDASWLASEREPVDPMEQAIHRLGQQQRNAAERFDGFELVHEYNLSPELLAMSHVWQVPVQETHEVAVKGAPEAVARLCQLDPERTQALLATAHAMASNGLRVLAVARASFEGHDWPATQQGFDFELLGLVGLSDPVRPGVPEAIRDCRAAGIRVVMITGDYPETARAIARQAGLAHEGRLLTGTELAALDDQALRERVKTVAVYARVRPEQKLRIVEALKANGEVVAMTGDGVNDAPSLKAAHIGIAMGQRGTDVAREAAALVLLKDDFASMVGAIRAGRGIFDNLRKAMAYVLAVHVPIAGLSLLPLLLGWPLVFMPVHIAFLELVIDPVASLVFENEPQDGELMRRPPRDPAAPLFSLQLILLSLLQGGLVLAVVGGLFAGLWLNGVGEAQARAMTFVALVSASFGLVLLKRGMGLRGLLRPNPALLAIAALTVALLALALLLPAARGLFQFAALPLEWVLGAGLLGLLAPAAALPWQRRGLGKPPAPG
jgi:Ca2+-transporting ATPase